MFTVTDDNYDDDDTVSDDSDDDNDDDDDDDDDHDDTDDLFSAGLMDIEVSSPPGSRDIWSSVGSTRSMTVISK